jgi:hypothetical protein
MEGWSWLQQLMDQQAIMDQNGGSDTDADLADVGGAMTLTAGSREAKEAATAAVEAAGVSTAQAALVSRG